MRMLEPAALISVLAIAVPAQEKPQGDEAVIARFLALYEKGEFIAALDLFEPVLADHYVDLRRRLKRLEMARDGTVLEATYPFLVRLYERADRLERGVAYLHGLYGSKVLGADAPRSSERASIEDNLFELALLARKVELAGEILAARAEREDPPSLDLDRARLHFARGEAEAAVALLTEFLEHSYFATRTQMLVRREFRPLHGNEAFRKVMTETTDLVAARDAREREMAEPAKPGRDVTVDQFRAAFDVFEKLTGPENQKALAGEMRTSHEVIAPNVERFRTEALALLRADKKGAAYRLAVAWYLVALHDPPTTKQVAAALKQDSFVAFPEQLFRLTYAIADVDAEAARPFLLQMMQAKDARIVLPAHAMSLAGNELLLQVFGRVETRCLDDLLGWAAAGEQPRGDRAAWLLVSFGEPRFVPILERALAATKDAAARTRLIQQLGHLRVPEAKTALQKLANAEGTTPEDVKAIGELVAKLAPAAPRTVPDPSLAITDPAMRAIFFDNLALTNGRDVSSVDEVLWATAKPADIPRLQAIRESIFGRFSDEAIGDWDRVSELITWLRWQ